MRTPVPYVEVLEMKIGDTVKKYKKYTVTKVLIALAALVYAAAFLYICFMEVTGV